MLVLTDEQDGQSDTPTHQIPVWFEEWEQTLSRFRSDSELMQLNRTSDQPIHVGETLWEVFQAAVWADTLTGGLVTPTVLDALVQAGYDRNFDSISRDDTGYGTAVIGQVAPLSLVISDDVNRTLCLPQGIQLDLGGIAKGWAAHQAAEKLKEYAPVVMNAGGDIAVSGPRADGSAWPIGISNPFEAGSDFDILYVDQCGIATSGSDRRNWRQNGILQHHIINPMTGLPAESDVLRATVVAPNVMDAEAAAKAVFILGLERGMEWIEMNPQMAAVFILKNGRVFYSKRMSNYTRK